MFKGKVFDRKVFRLVMWFMCRFLWDFLFERKLFLYFVLNLCSQANGSVRVENETNFERASALKFIFWPIKRLSLCATVFFHSFSNRSLTHNHLPSARSIASALASFFFLSCVFFLSLFSCRADFFFLFVFLFLSSRSLVPVRKGDRVRAHNRHQSF